MTSTPPSLGEGTAAHYPPPPSSSLPPHPSSLLFLFLFSPSLNFPLLPTDSLLPKYSSTWDSQPTPPCLPPFPSLISHPSLLSQRTPRPDAIKAWPTFSSTLSSRSTRRKPRSTN